LQCLPFEVQNRVPLFFRNLLGLEFVGGEAFDESFYFLLFEGEELVALEG